MREKRIQQTLQAVREGFQKAREPIDDVAVDFAIEMARDPRFQQLANRPEQIAMASVVAGCLHGAKEYDALPAEQWDQFLEKLKQELPYGLRPGFRTGIREMVKTLPKRPSTGRNEKLKPEQKKKACDLVSKYYRDGDSKRTAYEKVAGEMNCSTRTIHRAWTGRASLRGKTK